MLLRWQTVFLHACTVNPNVRRDSVEWDYPGWFGSVSAIRHAATQTDGVNRDVSPFLWNVTLTDALLTQQWHDMTASHTPCDFSSLFELGSAWFNTRYIFFGVATVEYTGNRRTDVPCGHKHNEKSRQKSLILAFMKLRHFHAVKLRLLCACSELKI